MNLLADALEVIDILDPYTTEKTGETQTRAQAYKAGGWHAVFHLWIINTEKRTLYVQKRSQNKLFSKGLLDVTVGGTLRHGESVEDGIREVHEEIRINLKYEDITFLEKRYSLACEEGHFNHQISYVFLYATDLPLLEIKYNPEEVSGLFEIPFDEMHKIFADPDYKFPTEGVVFTNQDYELKTFEIHKKLFVPSIDDYPCKIARFGEDYNNLKIRRLNESQTPSF